MPQTSVKHSQQPPAPKLRPDHLAALADLARSEAGIRLTPEKIHFLQTRLARRVTASGSADFSQYIALLKRDKSERVRFTEALTVHTTSFFRENHQYRWLHEEGLPELSKRRSEITFWSAACSTGQEGYTALVVAENYRTAAPNAFRFRLIGTDISTVVIAAAKAAIYPPTDLETVSAKLRQKYFLRARDGSERHRIVPELRKMAEWRQANLVTGTGLAGITADVAFLRNVLIYFDAEIQATVIDRVVHHLRPGGYLLTGHSETGVRHRALTPVQPSIYQKTVQP